MLLLREAYEDQDVVFVSTVRGLDRLDHIENFRVIPDCNRNKKLSTVLCAAALFRIFLITRPQVVVTTGALPGLLALAIGRTFGCKTIWIDSIANTRAMSMSGKGAKRFATHWISQWEDVALEAGATYAGSVL